MTEFTTELLATQAGITAAIMIVTEAAKWIFGLKDNCVALRVIAAVVGIAISLVWLPTLSVHSVIVGVLNGVLCALVAMKGYELVAPVAKGVWHSGE